MNNATAAGREAAWERARSTGGASAEYVYRMVAGALDAAGARGDILLDVGCGGARLRSHVRQRFGRYIGADVIRYPEVPDEVEVLEVDLDRGGVPLPDAAADVVAAVEIIEHVENPRALFRELVRLTRAGGWVVVTTPNQLSLLSKCTLLVRNEFNAFQHRPGLYPCHITALLEVDLRRMAAECGLADVQVRYSLHGRMPGMRSSFPRWLARLSPRTFSDNVLLIGRKLVD